MIAVKIQHLRINCDKGTCVEVWTNCHSPEDVDDLIAWLQLAKGVMVKWEKINAKASRAPKAPAGKNEAPQPGQVQGGAQSPGGANGVDPSQARTQQLTSPVEGPAS